MLTWNWCKGGFEFLSMEIDGEQWVNDGIPLQNADIVQLKLLNFNFMKKGEFCKNLEKTWTSWNRYDTPLLLHVKLRKSIS